MKNSQRITSAFILCIICMLGTPLAYSVIKSSTPDYLNGGVGEEELEKMRMVAKSYPLRMVFSEGDGAYVANVIVGIYDHAGNIVFYEKNSGPYLYVKLASGDYKVVAIYKDVKRSHKITIDIATSKKIFFNWSAPNEADEALSSEKDDEKDDLKIP